MNNRVIEENVTWMMIVLSKTFLACVADVIKPWLTRSLVSSVAQAVELSAVRNSCDHLLSPERLLSFCFVSRDKKETKMNVVARYWAV